MGNGGGIFLLGTAIIFLLLAFAAIGLAIGALATLLLIGVAGFVSFDQPKTALLAAGAFFVINMFESNLATPMILGRRLPLNAVALFLGLLFWGWIWGITGAVLAVPLTVMVKIICDHVEPLEPVALFLDS